MYRIVLLLVFSLSGFMAHANCNLPAPNSISVDSRYGGIRHVDNGAEGSYVISAYNLEDILASNCDLFNFFDIVSLSRLCSQNGGLIQNREDISGYFCTATTVRNITDVLLTEAKQSSKKKAKTDNELDGGANELELMGAKVDTNVTPESKAAAAAEAERKVEEAALSGTQEELAEAKRKLAEAKEAISAVTEAQESLSNILGASYEQKISDWNTEIANSCDPKRDRAETCCGDSPASCVNEAFGADESKSNLGIQALNLLAQGSMSMSGSIGQLCGRMKTVATGATAINVALGATCARMVGICKRDCGKILDEIESEKTRIQAEAAVIDGINIHDELQPLNSVLTKAKSAVRDCKTADNGTVRAAMSAFASYQAAKMSDLCKAQSGDGNGLENIGTNSFDVDCAAAGAAANPVCQAQCQRPGAENDPICRSILQNLNGGARTAANFNPGADGTEAESFDIGDNLEDDQQVNVGDIQSGQSGIASASPGGGGGLSGGGGGGGGGGGPAAVGGPAGSRNPSSILKGTNSGNGYSRGSSLRTGTRGGYRGPASGSAKGGYKKGKKFSLKDFLPGGKANPKRGLAGFAKRNPEIGAKSDDLFNRITARFYEICLKNRLYDCKTITNLKRGR